MNGIHLFASTENNKLSLAIEPSEVDENFDAKAFMYSIKETEYADYLIEDKLLFELFDTLDSQKKEQRFEPIEGIIGERRDASLKLELSEDKLIAHLKVISAQGGENADAISVMAFLAKSSIVRGISRKRIDKLVSELKESPPGSIHKIVVAKGLPPRTGRGSKLCPLVPNALDRALTPSQISDKKVDMRDFGDIICVKQDQAVARRLAPKKGRDGYTVTGKTIPALKGDWHKIKLGSNVYISPKDENLVCAKIDGLPKFSQQKISVDDVFVTNGVNVSTGNIKYAGAVIVNGDVNEKMKIEADGDVTVNGFVESAYIQSSGDIIITQGATGKIQDKDCHLIAGGSVFLQHGQGLKVTADNDICAIKQLAHSELESGANVIIGNPTKPMGKIFACQVHAGAAVKAGTLGAISGSELCLDYSKKYTALHYKLTSLNEMYADLLSQYAEHEKHADILKTADFHHSLHQKKESLMSEIELERVFLDWLKVSRDELNSKMKNFKSSIVIVANKSIFPGLKISIEDQHWKAETEQSKCKIIYQYSKWKKLRL